MFRNLSPGAIGIRGLGLADTIALARETGFEGAEFPIREAARLAGERGVEIHGNARLHACDQVFE